MRKHDRPVLRKWITLKTGLVLFLVFGMLASMRSEIGIARSTILLEDDFENGLADGWMLNDGTWSVMQDTYGNYVYAQSDIHDGGTVLAGDLSWDHYTFEADVTPIVYNGGGNSLVFRYGQEGFYVVYMTDSIIKLLKKSGGVETVLDSATRSFPVDVTNRVKVSAIHDQLRVYLNDEPNPIVEAIDDTAGAGGIGLQTWLTSASFDNVFVSKSVLDPDPVWNVLIEDDFESGVAEDYWTIHNGTWSITPDVFGNRAFQHSNTEGGGTVLRGEVNWEDYTFEADVTPISYNGGGNSLLFRYSTSGFYLVYVTDSSINLIKKSDGETTLDSASRSFPVNETYRIKVSMQGEDIRVYLDDHPNPVLEASDSTISAGGIGLQTWLTSARFDNILVKGPYEAPEQPPNIPILEPFADITLVPGMTELNVQGTMSNPTLEPIDIYYRIFGKFGDYSEEVTDLVSPQQAWSTVYPVNHEQQDDYYVYELPSLSFDPIPGPVTYSVKIYARNGTLLGESTDVFAEYEAGGGQ